jgi:hypothetical protein
MKMQSLHSRCYITRQADFGALNIIGSRCEARYLENIFGPSSLLAGIGTVRLLRLRIGSRDALEKERDRHTQHLAQLMESAGTDAVFGLLVFVQLLVFDAQGCGQLWLAYSQGEPPLSHTRSDMNIDWMRLVPFRAAGSSFGSHQPQNGGVHPERFALCWRLRLSPDSSRDA